jgi:Tol biopolymer transport system component
VANGWGDRLSPDGRWVTYTIPMGAQKTVTNIKATAGGDPRSLGNVKVLAWSPDSRRLAVRDGARLALVDATSGTSRDLARGAIGQASFSPDGKAIAFSRGNHAEAPRWRSNIFVVRLTDDSESQLTNDGYSDHPVWGSMWIAFRRFQYKGTWTVGALYLMQPDGSGVRRLAAGKEGPTPTFLGLDPVEFSNDGTRVLGCEAGEFKCSPEMFNVPGGEAYDLSIASAAVTQVQDLSEDGTKVLSTAGAFDGPPRDLYSIPSGGGSPRLLVKNVSSARWAGG